MSRKITVYVSSDAVRCLDDGTASDVFASQAGQRLRLSHVEPVSAVLRVLFHVLRRAGDETFLAAWTRRWPCRWRVNFAPLNGPVFFHDEASQPFRNRQEAVAFELRQVESLYAKESRMLVLTRKRGESLTITTESGEVITVAVIDGAKRVRLGVTAPMTVNIHRTEAKQPASVETAEGSAGSLADSDAVSAAT